MDTMDTGPYLSTILQKEANFVISCLLRWTMQPMRNGVSI